jgi:hypothetical protein
MGNYFSRICGNRSDQNRILDLLSDLTPVQLQTVRNRYINQLNSYKHRCHKYDLVFHICRITVLISSLLVPALLSIQYNSLGTNANYNEYVNSIFWLTWVLSLTVGILNGSLLLFRVEKKYYLLHIIKSQLEAEGFYYSALSGRYNGYLTPGVVSNHQNQFVFFIHAIERITMRETDVEYFRQYDNNMNINLHNDIPVRVAAVEAAVVAVPQQAENRVIIPQAQPPQAGVNLYHPSPDQPIIPAEAPPRDDGNQEEII